jgi:hypothetical protein
MRDNVGRPRPDFESAKSEISDTIKKEKQSATEALHDAQDAITRKASEYASDAKEALFEHAEGTQQNLSANMAAFGGALRAASEHLANSDQRAASKFVLDAAGGLERLSSSLKNKPFEEVLGEIRSFGRQNSGALIAGSVLAGLALGRFIKSSAPDLSQNETASEDSESSYIPPTNGSDPSTADMEPTP